MHELQQKDKKVILSAKALETIYNTASSLIGKLILGKTVPWWICLRTSTRQGGSGRKGVAFQEEEETTTKNIGSHKDKH